MYKRQDSDVYMFGLVYNTVIEGNNIDFTRKDALMRELQNKISFFKRNDGHLSLIHIYAAIQMSGPITDHINDYVSLYERGIKELENLINSL